MTHAMTHAMTTRHDTPAAVAADSGHHRMHCADKQASAYIDMCCNGEREDIVRRLWQYMNAAHILGYIGLSPHLLIRHVVPIVLVAVWLLLVLWSHVRAMAQSFRCVADRRACTHAGASGCVCSRAQGYVHELAYG